MIQVANALATASGNLDEGQLDLFHGLMPAAAPVAGDPRLSRIGHDLRTALNAIMGFSEIMTHKLHGPLGHPKYDEYASHVRKSGEALLAVTDEVLALAAHRMVDRGYGFSAG
jgi:signal transduction histidine kinase